MNKYEAEEFANYEVYEMVNNTYHCICICEEYYIAKGIAMMLAEIDKSCDTYYVGPVVNPGDLIPGGGWYDSWHKDKKTGKLIKDSLS